MKTILQFFKKNGKKGLAIWFAFIFLFLCVASLITYICIDRGERENTTLWHPDTGIVNKDNAKTNALQEALQTSIREIEQVDNCRVILGIDIAEKLPLACVVITTNASNAITLEKQAAIKKLVESSVADISESDIVLIIQKE